MIRFIINLFKKKVVKDIEPVVRGEIFGINLKQYPKYISFISMCPSTRLFDQDSFEYKVQKVGEDYVISSDYNNGFATIKEAEDIDMFNCLKLKETSIS